MLSYCSTNSCCNQRREPHPFFKIPLLFVGSLLSLFAVVQYTVGVEAYTFIVKGNGSWWAALLPSVCGLLSFHYYRETVIACLVTSVIGIAVAIAGATTDEISGNYVRGVICEHFDLKTGTTACYGSSTFCTYALSCEYGRPYPLAETISACFCYNPEASTNSFSTFTSVAFIGNLTVYASSCMTILLSPSSLAQGRDCGSISATYAQLLVSSGSLSSVLSFLLLLFTIICVLALLPETYIPTVLLKIMPPYVSSISVSVSASPTQRNHDEKEENNALGWAEDGKSDAAAATATFPVAIATLSNINTRGECNPLQKSDSEK